MGRKIKFHTHNYPFVLEGLTEKDFGTLPLCQFYIKILSSSLLFNVWSVNYISWLILKIYLTPF